MESNYRDGPMGHKNKFDMILIIIAHTHKPNSCAYLHVRVQVHCLNY